MAVKDVKAYYLKIQDQYLEMIDNAKDFDEALKAGIIEEWQVKQAQDMTARLKENLDRWTAMIMLLNEPAKKLKKEKYYKQNKILYKSLSGNLPDDVINENIDVLKHFKATVKKNQENL